MSKVDFQQKKSSGVSAASVGKLDRRKIWELPERTLGLLLATAFSGKESSRIMRFHPEVQDGKKVPETKVIEDLTYMGPFSKAVGKQLDKKFRQELRQFPVGMLQEELQKKWHAALEEGGLASLLWPVLTHPAASEAFQSRCYWDGLQSLISRSRMLEKSKTQLRELEGRLASTEDRLKGSSNIQELRQNDQSRIQQLQNEMNLLKARLASFHNQHEKNEEIDRRFRDVSKALKKEQYLTAQQQERIARLEAQLELSSNMPGNAEFVGSNYSEHAGVNADSLAQQPEIDDCSNCDSHWAKGLDGRSVLYVGGRTRQVARLRKMVEVHGGRFVHHDGGLHDGFSRLKEVVDCADVVLCPLNCISHNASGHIKKCCKQANKPLCFLKTSGVSAFNEGLRKAMENDGISLVS